MTGGKGYKPYYEHHNCDILVFVENRLHKIYCRAKSNHFRWKIYFNKRKAPQERSNLMKPENPPVLTFTIDFEAARQFRYSNGLPAQFRKRDWHDLTVEVYL